MTRTLLFLLAATTAIGQPVPKLNSLSPEWIQRGTTADITLSGENLGDATAFIFSGEPGLSATNLPRTASSPPAVTIESASGAITRAEKPRSVDPKRIVARVTVSASAALNARELRVVTPNGISNPLLINVSHLPELTESSVLSLPAAVSGVIGAAAEVDQFKFKATKGQELIFEVDAARRGSALDSSLAVLNAKGKEIARNEDYNGLDSLLSFTAHEDGEYTLQLRDFRYMGGGNFTYRV